MAAMAIAIGTIRADAAPNLRQLPESEIADITSEAGAAYGIAPELLQAIAWQESRYCPDVSNGQCVGLMQVNATYHAARAEKLGVSNLYEPRGNVLVAADYLAELFRAHGGAVDAVLMYYNGDSRAAKCERGEIPASEYAQAILARAAKLEREHGK